MAALAGRRPGSRRDRPMQVEESCLLGRAAVLHDIGYAPSIAKRDFTHLMVPATCEASGWTAVS